MKKILVTTVPFAERDKSPLDRIKNAGITCLINPIGRRLKEDELIDLIGDVDVLIAGTEPITNKIMSKAPRLKLISRVGVGLDGVDLLAARQRGIQVSYTPDAPAPAVAELTLGLMLALMRFTHLANADMHSGIWKRHFGLRACDVTLGLIGCGRIGGRLIRLLGPLGFKRILVNDTDPTIDLGRELNVEKAEKIDLFRNSDLISVHVPLSKQTFNMIDRPEMLQMRAGAMLVNTARGGIINEQALADFLTEGRLSGAAIDVFEEEPYAGPLAKIKNCLLTAHMGSMSVDCRTRMEVEATEEAVRFLTGQKLLGIVPEAEYELRKQAK